MIACTSHEQSCFHGSGVSTRVMQHLTLACNNIYALAVVVTIEDREILSFAFAPRTRPRVNHPQSPRFQRR